MGGFVQLVPLVLIFGIFYFMIIKPQKKQQQQHADMLGQLKIGDYVVSIGGIKGVITKLKDTEVRVRVASGVEMDFLKTAIARVENKKSDEE